MTQYDPTLTNDVTNILEESGYTLTSADDYQFTQEELDQAESQRSDSQ